jgi:O-antigen/teichoic acid export membrane protein
MEFGKHLKKGFWGLADKSLPAIYGLGFVLLVIRVLPKEEFGTYVLIQNLFLLLVAAGTSFALQPMVKYAAETDDITEIASTGNWMYIAFVLFSGIIVVTTKNLLAETFQIPSFASLAWYLPLMLFVSIARNVLLYLFQSKLQIRQMFYVNVVYYLGSLLLIAFAFQFPKFQTAEIMLVINTITLGLSSVIAFAFAIRTFSFLLVRNMMRIKFAKIETLKFWNYGKYSFGATAIYTFYTQADSYIIASFLGPVSVALYNAAKIFTRVYDAVLQISFTFIVPASSKFSSQGDEKSLTALAEKSIFFFTTAVAIFSLGLFLFAPEVLAFLYQGKYSDAIPLLRALSLSGIFIPLLGISASFLAGTGRVKEFFLATLFNTLFAIVLYSMSSKLFGVHGVALSNILISLEMAASYTYAIIRFGKLKMRWSGVLLRYRDGQSFLRKWLFNR